MQIFNRLVRTGLGTGAYLMSFLGSASAATVNFSAQIAYEGACEITVTPTITFNNGQAILPSQIEAKADVTKQTFNLILANCKGIKVTPKIIVSGNVNSTYGQDLFLDSGSTAVGYGILLSTAGNTTFQANSNLATNKQISAVKSWNVNTNLATINGTLPLSAALTCANCTAADRVGGKLNASVTFDFQYEWGE
ncbi:fimbrial-like protein [Providencia rettgeri]|nr:MULTISPECIES: fimbrial-like protein [Providencia]MDK3109890.1 fimbrial-like protein [Providencia rettgeri]MDL9987591.1 fimbrial-like protein [Providencia rettgeri]